VVSIHAALAGSDISGHRDFGIPIFCQANARTDGPVIEPALVALETFLKEVAVLTDVVQQTCQIGGVSCIKHSREASRLFSDVPQVAPQGITSLLVILTMREIDSPIEIGHVLPRPTYNDEQEAVHDRLSGNCAARDYRVRLDFSKASMISVWPYTSANRTFV
jgi:hypothetical protein